MQVNCVIVRRVMMAWLVGWYIKGCFFFPYFFHEIVQVPIRNSFFPAIFSNSLVAQLAYVLPFLTIFAIFESQPLYFRLSSCLMTLSSGILSWHQDTYNDATFVTSFWVAVWLLWVSINLDRRDAEFRLHARVLAVSILSVVFMGGWVGKLTAEYWNGQIIYHIFIVSNNHWPAIWLKNFLPREQVQLWCVVISRLIIGLEMFLSFSLFFPFRLVRFWAPFLMGGIMLFSTWRILSVLSCLFGMIWFCGGSEKFDREEKGHLLKGTEIRKAQ